MRRFVMGNEILGGYVGHFAQNGLFVVAAVARLWIVEGQ
jgi:hypothetical protein